MLISSREDLVCSSSPSTIFQVKRRGYSEGHHTMKNKMFITSILALLLVPLANSCDPVACKVGTSVGSGVCQVGATVGGVVAASVCLVGGWLTFGLSCLGAGALYAGVGAGCAGVGEAVVNACDRCASDDAPNYAQIAKKLNGIEKNQVENHLKQEAWFQQLLENDKNIILRQGEMIALQQTTVGQLDQLITTTETLGNKINHTQIITLYGNDFKHVGNVRNYFKLLTRGTSGVIVNDHRAKVFHDAALSPVFGSEATINNIFLMLRGGHILKKESIYETSGDKFCKPEVHKYFVSVLVEALQMHGTALAMDGHTLLPQLTKNFKENIMKATSAYNQHCDCAPGLKKANRGNVSTLLDRLPSSSHNLIQNRAQVAAMENNVMRLKMDLTLNVKNIEPNEFVESILEKHSVEDIELVVASVMSKKEDDLELHNSADICVDKERNKVKTCAAFTPDSFVNGCVPPQTPEHGRFLCAEDGVTCHVVCDKGYFLETTDNADMFMECLDNTWSPLPATFKCVPVKTCAAFTPDSLVNGCVPPQTLEHGRFLCLEDKVTCHVVCDKDYVLETTNKTHMFMECLNNTWTPLPATFKCVPAVPTCKGNATTLSTSPRYDMVLCKDKTESTCEKDFETLCPAGWNLCTPGQFNNRNHGWNYNWVDVHYYSYPLGAIYCKRGATAGQYRIDNHMLNADQPFNCKVASSQPGCSYWAGKLDCDNKGNSALCCAPSRSCGDGEVQQEEEECDDGNRSNDDDCVNSCTWKFPGEHGLSGC